MPKQRILSPEFWNDPDVAEITRDERLLLAGMFTLCADDEGRLLAEPMYLRKMVFGYDEDLTRADVARMVDNIVATCRNVVRYHFEGQAYIFLKKFAKHQQIRYVVLSKLPPPPEIAAPSYINPPVAEVSRKLPEIAEISRRVELSRVEKNRVDPEVEVEERILAPAEPLAADAADTAQPEPSPVRTVEAPKTPRAVNGFNYGEMWELIEADVGERITWNRDKEGRAVKNLLSRHQDAEPADFAAFLRYKRQTFRGDPNGEVTFSRYYEDFGAWWRAGKPDKPERTTTNGRTHEPDNLTRKLKGIAASLERGADADPDPVADRDVLNLRARPASGGGGAGRNGKGMGARAGPGA